MCGIIGFANPYQNYLLHYHYNAEKIKKMKNTLSHRGPDDAGEIVTKNACLGHTRLAIRDVMSGIQPMTKTLFNKTSTIVFNGEIYNTDELISLLKPYNISFSTHSDTEILLYVLMIFGESILKTVNGIFSLCYVSEKHLLLARDHVGIKPLFYTMIDDNLVFSSEIKGIFSYGIKPEIDKYGLNEIITLGPAHTPGNGVFKNVHELKPGYYLKLLFDTSVNINNPVITPYWTLAAKEHEDNYSETIEHTKYLLEDSINKQLVSDVPVCSFLSGGLDSSLVSSIACKKRKLETYSFDFIDNDKNFKANSFQSSLDREYVEEMVKYLNTKHSYLFCDSRTQFEYLTKSVDARDMPGMADVESSLMYFCKEVSNNHQVALTGECADEIFGGYPWFFNIENYSSNSFPWSTDLSTRTMLLKDSVIEYIKPKQYLENTIETAISSTPLLGNEDNDSVKIREISWLNITWFMQTLLTRMDRVSMFFGLEARVPMADYRILEYVYNVPWEIKSRNGNRKNILIEIGKNYLPPKILFRKKCPYPKTYDPKYEEILRAHLTETINSDSPLLQIYDKSKVLQFINSPKDYGKPWYGQLMAGPQLMAYLIQLEYWLDKYNLSI
ncbi:MAG: asparagine synthase (glutamine-hydrolyzing) [Lachnospiraceae bacterium]|nr:asparagine synthase (glutamine-hydrolyzing) [Lachnospiraceae bacterium]